MKANFKNYLAYMKTINTLSLRLTALVKKATLMSTLLILRKKMARQFRPRART